MKNNLILLFLFLLFCEFSLFSQTPSIDSDLLQKYQAIQKSAKQDFDAEDEYRQIEKQTEDTLTIPQPEISKDEVMDRVLGSYTEFIIRDNDTIQTLIKALPMELKFYGSDLFSGQPQKQIVSTNVIGDSYVLGAGDIISIDIWGDVNLSYELTIDSEGKIFIPKAGEISIAGRTIGETEPLLRRFFSKIYSNFSVSLSLVKIKNIKIYVIGEATRPGSYFMSGLSNVFNALDIAGGPNNIGSYRDIRIIRGKKTIAIIDLYEFLSKGSAAGNVNLTTNDIIFIPPIKGSVKIRGAVLNPARYELISGNTISDVVNLAGGLMPQANQRAICVDRVMGDNYSTISINLDDSTSADIELAAGDDISIFAKDPERFNTVFVKGHVNSEGAYSVDSALTVRKLFEGYNLLLDDTYLERIDLIRTNEDNQKELLPINLRLALEGDPHNDIALEEKDLILVFSIWNFIARKTVTIKGAVRKPGEYTLFLGMTVQDLVFIAGGLTEKAYLKNAEISRIFNQPQPTLIEFDIKQALDSRNSPDNILLEKDDILFVRSDPNTRSQDVVFIDGEVMFPGEYSIVSKYETLTDLITRAGGFTESAFPKGAIFMRSKIADKMEQRNVRDILNKTMPIDYDSLGRPISIIDYSFENLNRIIVDLSGSSRNSSSNDIIIQNGDMVHIPTIPSGVSIKGAVAFEGTIKYIKNKKMRYYIDGAGGLLRNGDKSAIRIVKYNGKTLKVSLNYQDIDPGDIIVVPFEKQEKKDILNIVMSTASVISSLATTIYILVMLKQQ